MSQSLHRYLVSAYVSHSDYDLKRIRRDFPIQIDDQDNNDLLSEFCNIFVVVRKKNCFEIELHGMLPVSREIADLAEIYGGRTDTAGHKVSFVLDIHKIDVLLDLAGHIRKTTEIPKTNPTWFKIASRTISSLYRFVRIIKEYHKSKNSLI
jgi:hypothetical protein